MTSRVYIGGAAGFAGDRTDAAGPLVEALAQADGQRFLMFETLAERTLALSQLERRRDPSRGYNPALDRFITPILARCLEEQIRIVGNFGAANPRPEGYVNWQPFEQVPAFRDGEVELFESGAILLYIAEKHGALLPVDETRRWQAIAWLFASLNSVEPSCMRYFAYDVFNAGQDWAEGAKESVVPLVRQKLKRVSDALGLVVSIDHRDSGGIVHIRYRDLDQLDEVVKRLSSKT